VIASVEVGLPYLGKAKCSKFSRVSVIGRAIRLWGAWSEGQVYKVVTALKDFVFQGIRRRNLDKSNSISVFGPEQLLLQPELYMSKPELSLQGSVKRNSITLYD
jgi:hypothetical protein